MDSFFSSKSMWNLWKTHPLWITQCCKR